MIRLPWRKRARTPARSARRRTFRPTFEALEDRNLLSNPIVLENLLAGTPQTTWDVPGAGDSTIQGFATDISVNQGQTISFKINDTSKVPYHIDIYRVGYYQGLGARLVTTIPSSQTLDVVQPNPKLDPKTALVDAGNWSVTASWAVPSTATSGVYFARVARNDTGGAFMILLVVRSDSSHSQMLFQTSDSTWEAYNTWGGYSLYQFTGSTSGPGFQGAAYAVSYNRPLIDRGSPGGLGDTNSFFYEEYPMVRYLEANGYDVSYFTDLDSDRNGALIQQHQIFMSVGHDEYWSGNQFNNVTAARNAGVNLAFFSGNEIFWKTYFSASIDGSNTPYRTLVDYKETHANAIIDPNNPNIWTGTWMDPRFSPPADGGRPQNQLSGTLFTVNRGPNDTGTPITVPYSNSQMRFWRNTSVAQLQPGQSATLGDFELGYEWDEDVDNGFRPAGLIDMSSTTQSVTQKFVDYGNTTAPGTATNSMTLYRALSGALVFSAGMVQYDWGLDGNHDGPSGSLGLNSTPVLALQQATVNLFADMNVQPGTLQAGLIPASASTDVIPPSSSITSPATGAIFPTGTAVTITGMATDTGGGVVAGIEVSVDGGMTWHPATGIVAGATINWSYTWIPDTPGQITIKSRATDDSGNIEIPSTGVKVTVPFPVSVAAYNFDEGAGSTLTDLSGNGNNGTIANATWGPGKFGTALYFTGATNSFVTIADASSLHLTNGMTLEAWVNPISLNSPDAGWDAAIAKEHVNSPNDISYALYAANGTTTPPAGHILVGSTDFGAQGISVLPLNTWTFLTATYNGTTLNLYVNSTLVGSRTIGGNIFTTTDPLKIGGDWSGEMFDGAIDNVRIYNVALSQTDIQIDMTTPVSAAATTSPNAPSGLGAVPASATSVTLSWTNNATNQTGFHLDRATDAGFTANLITQNLPVSPNTFSDSAVGLATGNTYYYRLRAYNSAGDSGNSNVASVFIPLAPPKPTNQVVTNVTTTEIDMSWQDNAGHLADGYKILRAVNHGTFSQVASLPPASGTPPSTYLWSDTNLTAGTFYEYHILAYNVSGNNDFADVNATTLTVPPSGLTATAGNSLVTLSWTAPTGAQSYNIYRSTASGLETVLTSGVTSTTYADSAVTNGTTYFYKVTAVNANTTIVPVIPSESALSSEVSATPAMAPPPLTVTLTAPAAGATISGLVTISATASDTATTVGSVQFQINGVNFGPAITTAPYSRSWNTTGLSNATYTITALATDSKGNSATASETVTVNNTSTGMVAAYNFDEGSGTILHDFSGNGNNGTITNATWSTAGKHGDALQFSGTLNSWVTVNDSTSLHLTNGMTLEAWVNPSTLNSPDVGWVATLAKEHQNSGNDIAYALYAANGTGTPAAGHILIGNSDVGAQGTTVTPLNTWTFLTATYNGSTLSIYVNGNLAGTRTISGNIFTTTDPLRIGGDWSGEMFTGLIDDVRVYNRALVQAAIQSDMFLAVDPPPGGSALSAGPALAAPQPGAVPMISLTHANILSSSFAPSPFLSTVFDASHATNWLSDSWTAGRSNRGSAFPTSNMGVAKFTSLLSFQLTIANAEVLVIASKWLGRPGSGRLLGSHGMNNHVTISPANLEEAVRLLKEIGVRLG